MRSKKCMRLLCILAILVIGLLSCACKGSDSDNEACRQRNALVVLSICNWTANQRHAGSSSSTFPACLAENSLMLSCD